jgi:hypothetical protein
MNENSVRNMVVGAGIGGSIAIGIAFFCSAFVYGNTPEGHVTPVTVGIVASILFGGLFIGSGIGALSSLSDAREVPGEVVGIRMGDGPVLKKITVRVWIDRESRDIDFDRFLFTKLPKVGHRVVFACYNMGPSKDFGPIKEIPVPVDVDV